MYMRPTTAEEVLLAVYEPGQRYMWQKIPGIRYCCSAVPCPCCFVRTFGFFCVLVRGCLVCVAVTKTKFFFNTKTKQTANGVENERKYARRAGTAAAAGTAAEPEAEGAEAAETATGGRARPK